jgi:YihY family inner membrane protein
VLRGQVFFWAGAITFNALVAVVPLLLLVVGAAGFVLAARFGDPASELVELFTSYLPTVESAGLRATLRRVLQTVIDERGPLSIIGGLVLLWISTRFVTCLRIVLGQLFETVDERGIVAGKLFDLTVVVAGGALLVLNLGATVGMSALQAFGAQSLGLGDTAAGWLQLWSGRVLSLASAWGLFALLYWRLPARRVPFRTAAVGANFAAVGYEAIKLGFEWYATSVANYASAYGSLGVLAVLFFWVYYSAVVFVLGGQVARVHELKREERMRLGEAVAARTSAPLGGGLASLVLLLVAALPPAVHAQSVAPFGGNGNIPGFLNTSEGVVFASSSLESNFHLERPLIEHDGPYVVVHIADSRVLVLEGTEVVWSAPAGTGHGFRLEGQGRSWTFTTPVGMFRVLRREKDPVWIAPDWYYIEQGMRIPPAEQRARVPGTLGTSALFLGDGIAIHGTNNPGLLLDPDPDTRRVSHGCIRLTNEAARELYHRVEVGTPVLIF